MPQETKAQPFNAESAETVPGFAHENLEGQIPSIATDEEIRVLCRGQIAHYKVPRYVRFVDSFPLTISGKVQKYLIREHMRSELNLTEERHA